MELSSFCASHLPALRTGQVNKKIARFDCVETNYCVDEGLVIEINLPIFVFDPLKCTEICALTPDHGPADKPELRYHYHKASGTCKLFVWGGVFGNDNNFATKEECEENCKGQ